MKNLTILIFILITSISSAQIDKYLRKGSKALERNKLEKAKANYLKAYHLDSSAYEANVALGYVISQYMFKYEEALPYLERALIKTPVDTFPDLLYSLATCYQHIGEFKKAQPLFDNLLVKATQDKEQDKIYIIDLEKRKKDCIYAESNKASNYNKKIYVGNLGPKINTELPEYVPVISPKNELLFTSRRKDFKKEKTSSIDDKYIENIYISQLSNGKPQAVKTYSISKTILKTKPRKWPLSIISISSDGKLMYIFQKNKVYELNINDNQQKAVPLSKNVNIDYYQNHATVSKDGKMLLFTSEDERGTGGLDIYKSIKGSDGSWGVPENLGNTINTEHDEDSPYLSDDGETLYFSSKGHEGFGNYDIYKSTLTKGKWSAPENLGQPINSSGNDIFMVESDNMTSGYFSSYRKGGYGDMDIYKITPLDKFNKECSEKKNSLLSINSTLIDKESFSVKFETSIPNNLNVIAYQWMFNQTKLPNDASQITQTIASTSVGDSVFVKVIAGCDTCIEPIILCNNTVYNLPVDALPVVKTDEPGKNPYDDKLILNYLSKSKLDALGFNISPIHFNLNKSNIREDAIAILKNNLEVLSKHPELSILIYGFADSRGKESYNLPLSKKRAQGVKSYLVSKGLNKKQIEQVNGRGEEFILNKCTEGVTCEDPEHEVNRRVEFIIFEKK